MIFDATVIGAGTNGLTCAAYLAKAGLTTAVLENEDVIGGGPRTDELTSPGFKHDVFASVDEHIMHEPVLRDLNLSRFGFKEVIPDPVCTTLFPDGKSLSLNRDLEITCKNIERFSKRYVIAYQKLYQIYLDNHSMLEEGEFSSPPSMGSSSPYLRKAMRDVRL